MLVGLVGFIGSGKNTAADFLVGHHQFTSDSFARALKDVVSVVFGWDRDLIEGNTVAGRKFRDSVDVWWAEKLGIPDFTPRKALQLIGTDVMRDHFDDKIWILTLQRRLKQATSNIVVSDARFTNEINLLHDNGAKIIRIKRGPEPEWYYRAISANAGNDFDLNIMQTKYADVHISEWGWVGSKYDIVIENDGTVEELCEKINKIV